MDTIIAPPVNLLDPQFYVDPFDAYRWLRDTSPVHWDPVQKIWGISRHADILHVEKATSRYSSLDGSRPHTDQRADQSMINLDDPAHQTQRMLVARRFTPRAVRNHEAEVREICDRLIDPILANGGGETVDLVASALPAMVIGRFLGYPDDAWPLVRKWSEVTMFHAGQTRTDGQPTGLQPESQEVIAEFGAMTYGLLAERRADPQDDLLSLWAHSETDGVPWDDGKIMSECLLLLDGGAETTRSVIGSIIRELALQPDVQRRLRAEPELLRTTAVEEFIRWVTPISNMRRTVTEDHEYQGQELHAGDEVLLMYGAANRDDRVFDDPETFDVARPANHHVAFGFGTHFCLGASLARLELRVVFEQLLARLPEWHLAPGTTPAIVPATFTRGYDAVTIEL